MSGEAIGLLSHGATKKCYPAEAQKEGKSDSELDEMWWKQAGELVAGYYKQREEVEKDVEGVVWNTGEILGGCEFEEGYHLGAIDVWRRVEKNYKWRFFPYHVVMNVPIGSPP